MLKLKSSDVIGLVTGHPVTITRIKYHSPGPIRLPDGKHQVRPTERTQDQPPGPSNTFLVASTAVGAGLVYAGVSRGKRNKWWHVLTGLGALNLARNSVAIGRKIDKT